MTPEITTAPQTLAGRMAQGRIPVPDALQYAMQLAEGLRKLHDSGLVHGALSPATVAMGRAGLEVSSPPAAPGAITPYTAPEIVRGQTADARSDIFSFGAIVYEMLTGHPPFAGTTPEELAAAICTSAPSPSGSPAVDRLVAGCLAKDPLGRPQKVQKLALELKLLTVAVRRAESQTRRESPEVTVRGALDQFESKINARLLKLEYGVGGVGERLAGMGLSLKSATEGAENSAQRIAAVEQLAKASAEHFDSLDQRTADIVHALQSVAQRFVTADQRATGVEQAVRATGERVAAFEGRHADFEQTLRAAADRAQAAEQRASGLEQSLQASRDLIGKLDERTADVEQAAQDAAARFTAVEGRASEIERVVNQAAERSLQGELRTAAVEHGLQTAQTTLAELGGRLGAVEPLGAAVAGLEQSLRAAADRSEAAERRTSDIERALQSASERFEAFDQRTAGIEQTLHSASERFEAFEQRISGMESGFRTVDKQFETIDLRVAGIDQALHNASEFFEAFDRRTTSLEQAVQTAGHHLDSLDRRIAGVEETLKTASDCIEQLQIRLDAVRTDSAALREAVAEDLHMFEKTLNAQAASIESARTAMAQTDDLVERVVEALESLQSVVLEHSGERAMLAG